MASGHRFLHGVLVACFMAGRIPSARAEAPVDKTARPQAVPPAVLADRGVSYPVASGLTEHVEVELILELDASGQVLRAQVVKPRGDAFDSEAIAAARTIRFAPATQGGRPVPAKLRYRYVFDPPPAELALQVDDNETGGCPSGLVEVSGEGRPTEKALWDQTCRWELGGVAPGAARVRVHAEGYESQSLEVKFVPGGRTELSFHLSRVPGAPHAAIASATSPVVPEILVIGKRRSPGVVTFTRDEVRQIPGTFGDPFRVVDTLPGVTPIISGLPYFYVRGAPPGNVGYYLDGIGVPYLYHVALGPSVVHPAIVKSVDVYTGAFPARYGRYSGGIVAADTIEPETRLHGEANIRLFDAGALVEVPFAGGKGAALVAGRFSYTAALLSLLAPDILLDYRDYQVRIGYDVTPHDRVTLSSFGAYDLLAQREGQNLSIIFGAEFYRANLRHEHRFRDASLTTNITGGYDVSAFGGGATGTQNMRDLMLQGRSELLSPIGNRAILRAGIDVRVDRYEPALPAYVDPDSQGVELFQALFPVRTDIAAGLYAELPLDISPRIHVLPGARFDLYSSADQLVPAFDPRLAVRLDLLPTFHWVSMIGYSHQPPSFLIPLPGLAVRNPTYKLQASLQTSTGFEWDVDKVTTGGVTVYNNKFTDLSDALGLAGGADGTGLGSQVQGAAQGLEVSVRRKLMNRVGGYLSYTLSKSTRHTDQGSAFSAFDRTHVASAALSVDLGLGYRAGVRGVFYTGYPFEPDGAALSETSPRTRPYYRVDARLEKKWSISQTGWLSLVIEMINVTLNKEDMGEAEIGPISLPSIGVEGGL